MNQTENLGFGMLPISPRMQPRYDCVIQAFLDFLHGKTSLSEISLDDLSELKGMFNRCLRQDQWDWFSVFTRFGEPEQRHMTQIVGMLKLLRRSIIDDNHKDIELAQRKLIQNDISYYLDNFQANRDPSSYYDKTGSEDTGLIFIISIREQRTLLKIGMTRQSMIDYVKEFNSAVEIKIPFSVRRIFRVKLAERAEREIHQLLSQYCVNLDRKFFELSYSRAVSLIDKHLQRSGLLLHKRERALKTTDIAPFKLLRHVTELDDSIVEIMSRLPCCGDIVKNEQGTSLYLGLQLGSGGEGTVYEVGNGLACKVYKKGCLKRSTIDKIKLMTSRKIPTPMICWPISLAYNSQNETIGYFMPKAVGTELMRAVFIKPLLHKNFPDWTRVHLVKLTSKILEAISDLHRLNVLLCDINARNILIQNESEVYFVDCDSYQVEGFPCPVGMPPFLAPELSGKNLRSTLRTLEHERFAIATLIFMLLHPGKPPYSHQGGKDPAHNVQKQHFPYPLGEKSGQGVPEGPWRYMFSHLPYRMKEAFHNVFDSGKRLSVADWQENMRRYKNDLDKGYVSDEISPTALKRPPQDQIKKFNPNFDENSKW